MLVVAVQVDRDRFVVGLFQERHDTMPVPCAPPQPQERERKSPCLASSALGPHQKGCSQGSIPKRPLVYVTRRGRLHGRTPCRGSPSDRSRLSRDRPWHGLRRSRRVVLRDSLPPACARQSSPPRTANGIHPRRQPCIRRVS